VFIGFAAQYHFNGVNKVKTEVLLRKFNDVAAFLVGEAVKAPAVVEQVKTTVPLDVLGIAVTLFTSKPFCWAKSMMLVSKTCFICSGVKGMVLVSMFITCERQTVHIFNITHIYNIIFSGIYERRGLIL